ncbi:unnamed protein product [Microthlaspi erraticum]|uniref:RNase H type-1 domain-containing protein n=1 Tax=Microthlaspi erraticum TaxID=1685480 RepID=A0A6D2KAG6_9BRAS|nr:unnamed protein product [Microthlaspi erraticum]
MRCGMAPETVNHTLFECPPALQVWALSPIPTAPAHFPTGGLFTNMTQLFWHLPNDERMKMYPWLIWYIWKARNDKVMANVDWDPNKIVVKAEAESIAWTKAQERLETTVYPHTETHVELSASGDICQVDGAWKETDCRAGLGLYYFNTNTLEKLMGTCNLRRGISPLQTELEALIWAMQCMLRNNKLIIVFQTDCSDVVKWCLNQRSGRLFHYYLRSSIEFTNLTGWPSRWSSWSSRWLPPSSFAYPVELRPCTKSFHAPHVSYAPECSKRPISKDQTCICMQMQPKLL